MPSQKTGYNNKIKLLFLGIVGGQKGKKTGEKTEKKSKIKKIKKEKSVPPAEGRRTVSRRRKIRRSGLDIKKEEKKEELSQIEEEKEWEIPAFLRK